MCLLFLATNALNHVVFAERPERSGDAAGGAVRHLLRPAVPAGAVDAENVRGQHGPPIKVLGGARQSLGKIYIYMFGRWASLRGCLYPLTGLLPSDRPQRKTKRWSSSPVQHLKVCVVSQYILLRILLPTSSVLKTLGGRRQKHFFFFLREFFSSVFCCCVVVIPAVFRVERPNKRRKAKNKK